MTESDNLLLLVAKVAAQRDREAFIRLFDHYAPRINAFLQRQGTDRATAEELTQEVMIALWQKAALFDAQKSSLGTWLFRIARNRRIDQLRREKARALAPEDQDDPALLPVAPPAADGLYDAQDREERVRRALATLPEAQLRLIELAFFDGLSHSEIAARTELPLGTVKSRLRLAFARLRRVLEDDAPE